MKKMLVAAGIVLCAASFASAQFGLPKIPKAKEKEEPKQESTAEDRLGPIKKAFQNLVNLGCTDKFLDGLWPPSKFEEEVVKAVSSEVGLPAPTGGKVKRILDRLDLIEANVALTSCVLDNSSETLKGVAHNHQAIKALIEQRDKVLEDKKKARTPEDKKALEEKEKEVRKETLRVWRDQGVLNDVKVGLKEQKVELGKLGQLAAYLGTATLANKLVVAEATSIAQEVLTVQNSVKDEVTNPLEAARTTKRLSGVPAQLGRIGSEAALNTEQLVVFLQAVKFLTRGGS